MKVKMKGEEHICVNFPNDTSLKKEVHSGLVEKWRMVEISCAQNGFMELELSSGS